MERTKIERPAPFPSGFNPTTQLLNFPPFYTKQIHPPTYQRQLQEWKDLIISWAQYHSVYRLDLTPAALENGEAAAIWGGNPLGRPRRVSLEFAREIVDSMVQASLAFYDPPQAQKPSQKPFPSLTSNSNSSNNNTSPPTTVYLLWRSIDDWASLIYDFAHSNGLINSILTLEELTESGEFASSLPFYRLPDPILRRALDVLVHQNRAQVFKGTTQEGGDGVKFFWG